MQDNVVNDVDANVQRLLLEALDCVVYFGYPVDQVRPVDVGNLQGRHPNLMAVYVDLVVTVDLHVSESGHLSHFPVLLLLFK